MKAENIATMTLEQINEFLYGADETTRKVIYDLWASYNYITREEVKKAFNERSVKFHYHSSSRILISCDEMSVHVTIDKDNPCVLKVLAEAKNRPESIIEFL